MTKRDAKARGSFYPYKCADINKMIQAFNSDLDNRIRDKTILSWKPRAIIVPHAGYVYSGFTANFAYRLLANSGARRVIVIGPSHRVAFKGISVGEQDFYESPCGDLEIDQIYIQEMKKHFILGSEKNAHKLEHSTETQMPFIKHYLPKARVVELIYGDVDYRDLAMLCYELLKDKSNVVVISTDLSHFYSQDKAEELDKICMNAILNRDASNMDRGCEACGKIGVKAILEVAKKSNLNIELLDYTTSASYNNDTKSVVGYVSAVIG
jgi:AmmeMemoRadiSam system protein B